MKNILVIRSSVNGSSSVSNQMLDAFLTQLRAKYPNLNVVERDLAQQPIPALTPETVSAIRAGVTENANQTQADQLASALIEEIKSADVIAIGIPRYNFHVPATLKSYIDYIARPRITFQYGANGPEGFLPHDTPVYGFVASAGYYSNNPDSDYLSLWLKQVFGFVGLNNLELIHTEDYAMGEDHAKAAFAKTHERIAQIVAST